MLRALLARRRKMMGLVFRLHHACLILYNWRFRWLPKPRSVRDHGPGIVFLLSQTEDKREIYGFRLNPRDGVQVSHWDEGDAHFYRDTGGSSAVTALPEFETASDDHKTFLLEESRARRQSQFSLEEREKCGRQASIAARYRFPQR